MNIWRLAVFVAVAGLVLLSGDIAMAGTPSGDTGSQVSQPYATAVGGPSAQGAADPGEPPQTLAERLAWEQAPKAETYIVDGDALAAQSDGG